MISLFSSFVSITATARDSGDIKAVRVCLENWGKKNPFKGERPEFRVIGAKVKVLGIGSDEVNDEHETSTPELVLVKPNVAVLSKSTVRLMNPNGCYCLKGKVAVLGSSEIQLHCKAGMASSNGGATVMGTSKMEGGVTVLGSTRVKRLGGCAQA